MRTIGCAFQILALAFGFALITGAIYQGCLFQMTARLATLIPVSWSPVEGGEGHDLSSMR